MLAEEHLDRELHHRGERQRPRRSSPSQAGKNTMGTNMPERNSAIIQPELVRAPHVDDARTRVSCRRNPQANETPTASATDSTKAGQIHQRCRQPQVEDDGPDQERRDAPRPDV